MASVEFAKSRQPDSGFTCRERACEHTGCPGQEALNISEEEQLAALAAPARSKRERAPRVDYKALAKGN